MGIEKEVPSFVQSSKTLVFAFNGPHNSGFETQLRNLVNFRSKRQISVVPGAFKGDISKHVKFQPANHLLIGELGES